MMYGMRYCLVILSLSVAFVLMTPHDVSSNWVEFKPGTCQVGPPPNCISGHWYWVEIGGGSSGLGGLIASQSQSFHGQFIDEHDREERSNEVSCMLEHEQYDIEGASGTASALSAGYQYSTEAGSALGLYASYDESKLTGSSAKTAVTVGSLYFQIASGEWARTSLTLSYNNVSTPGFENTGAYGGGINYTYNRFWKRASFLFGFGFQVSRAILPEEYQSSSQEEEDDLSDFGAATSVGLGFGIMPTERFSITFEALGSLGLDLQGIRDSTSSEEEEESEPVDYKMVYLGGVYMNYLFTDFWGLTFGYKKLIGAESYEGNEFTLGSSFRF